MPTANGTRHGLEPYLLVTGRGVVRCRERVTHLARRCYVAATGCAAQEQKLSLLEAIGQEENRRKTGSFTLWAGLRLAGGQGVLAEGSRAWAMALKSAAEAAGGPTMIPRLRASSRE